jgi:hypothetical protein
MDAWIYEMYLLVFKLFAALMHIKLEHLKINFISPRAHVLFSLLHPFRNLDDPRNLIGSKQCDLITNRTILAKSHLFFSQSD